MKEQNAHIYIDPINDVNRCSSHKDDCPTVFSLVCSLILQIFLDHYGI